MLRWGLAIALVASLVVLVFAWVSPGPLSIDEVLYHRMTHDLHAGHGFFLANGYEELRSAELTTMFVRAGHEGRLTAQYPYGMPVLSIPAYAAFGLRGMFLMNALAFAIAVLLCHRIAKQLFRDRRIALVASALFASTYALEYAFASWPHATALAAILGAMTLSLDAYLVERRKLCNAALAGLLLGIATSMRLDALLCVPAIGAPFFFAAPTRSRELAALALGMIPGLAFVVASNYVRWESLSPLSYGPRGVSPTRYILFAALAAGTAVALWIASRPRARSWIHAHGRLTLLAALAAILLALLVPRGYAALRGVVSLVFDLRLLGGVDSLSDTRAVVYAGGFKRSLLQSVPFFMLAVIPIVRAVREGRDRAAVAWCGAIPVLLIAFFGSSAWHGGLCLNLRYLVPALPFLCILAAVGLCELASGRRAWVVGSGATCAFVAYFALRPESLLERESLVLTVPLVLAAVIAVTAVAWLLTPRRESTWSLLIIASLGIGWTLAATVEDARWSRARRATHHDVSAWVGARISDRSLLIVDLPDPFYGVIEHVEGVHIALPYNDDFADVPRLVRYHLERGREIYGALPHSAWDTLHRRVGLRDTIVRPIAKLGPYLFAELQTR